MGNLPSVVDQQQLFLLRPLPHRPQQLQEQLQEERPQFVVVVGLLLELVHVERSSVGLQPLVRREVEGTLGEPLMMELLKKKKYKSSLRCR